MKPWCTKQHLGPWIGKHGLLLKITGNRQGFGLSPEIECPSTEDTVCGQVDSTTFGLFVLFRIVQ